MRHFCLYALGIATAIAQDTNCPRYPASERTELNASIDLDQLARDYLATRARTSASAQPRSAIARNNFVDNFIFDTIDANGIAPAPLTSDAEFLRRVSIDLTGRIPQPERLRAFLESNAPDKRAKLIDELMSSPAFADQWTHFFANKFEVTSGYYSYIGLQGRTLFRRFLQDFVNRDRSYKDAVTEMLTASGDANENGPANFLVRGWQDGDPMQDTYDTLTDRVSTRLLGIKTECISCHDGRRHLEQINLYMSTRRRREFYGLSAFFARMTFQRLNVDGFGQRARFVIVDRPAGAYSTSVDPNNPGPRPPRTGGPYTPQWLFDGRIAESPEWRKELARILTSDRQFARATVNYIWAAMFTYGLVDPADGWDLARLDSKNPPSGDWPLQLNHPELMERLAQHFIDNNYSIRSAIRLLANSNAYQLSSNYPGQWRPQYTRFFAKHFPRRLSAEELWDSLATATETETPMAVFGYDQPLYYANQLPDTTEPRNHSAVVNFMNLFGRGDWWNIKRDSNPSLLQLLYTMNDSQVVLRTFAARTDAPANRVARIAATEASDEDAIRQMFLATLSRPATQEEVALVMRTRKGARTEWLADLQWVLINKLDFIFNY